MFKVRTSVYALSMIAIFAMASYSASLTDSLKSGSADLKSANVMTFGPEGVLFVGDSLGGALYAFDTQDRTPSKGGPVDIKGINGKIAAMLGTTPDEVSINDLKVNPISKNMYLAVSRGRGPAAVPVILRVDARGKIEELATNHVPYSKVMLADAPRDQDLGIHPLLIKGGNPRLEAISYLAYVNGKVLVAGLANEEFTSALRVFPFPFEQATKAATVEIWHAGHGRFETQSPINTFVPYTIKGEQYILAAYTCQPLVKIPVASIKPGAKIRGTTIAELGGGSRPYDMIAYSKNGHNYFLMSTSNRGVLKISADGIESYEPITKPVDDITGVRYETVSELQGIARPMTVPVGVFQLDKFDDKTAAIVWRTGSGSMDLKTIALP